MAKTRMSWDFVNNYPIFIYTTFIDHNSFNVKLVKGVKGNLQGSDTGPQAPAWHEYKSEGFASKDEVVANALRLAKELLKKEELLPQINHTPGTWIVRETNEPNNEFDRYIYAEGYGVLGYWQAPDKYEEPQWILRKEDAYLIAAAPELFKQAIKANQYLAYLAAEGKLEGEQVNWERVQQGLSNAIKTAQGD